MPGCVSARDRRQSAGSQSVLQRASSFGCLLCPQACVLLCGCWCVVTSVGPGVINNAFHYLRLSVTSGGALSFPLKAACLNAHKQPEKWHGPPGQTGMPRGWIRCRASTAAFPRPRAARGQERDLETWIRGNGVQTNGEKGHLSPLWASIPAGLSATERRVLQGPVPNSELFAVPTLNLVAFITGSVSFYHTGSGIVGIKHLHPGS